MFRKNYLTLLLTVALSATGGIAAFAQTSSVLGRVEMKKADGTTVPVADAVVDVYRVDIKGKLPSGKTNSKGEFSFAGFPIGGQYVLAVSAPGAQADILPGVRAGNEKIVVTLVEGNGKRLTEDEARGALNKAAVATPAAGGKVELTAEQKKQKEEYDKQVTDITAKNAKSQQNDALIRKVLEEGNKAYDSKNYDAAIAKYDEGINAEPDYAGSAPVLLNNKAAALLVRARLNYNQSVKGDPTAKAAAMATIKKDLEEAAKSSDRSLTILKSATAPDANIQKSYDSNKAQALNSRKEAYWLMAKTGADRAKGKETLAAFEEYLTVETDAKKKSDAQLALGDALREAGDAENAIVAYRKALEMSPENPDVLAGLGLSLFNSGVVGDNTATKQEGLNYMQKFAETAPETHPLKSSVKDAVDYLKTQDKLTPQKMTKGSTKKKS